MESREILAERSYHELETLLIWFQHQGPTPVIIGGWAVYFYNSYLGSVDIDLVGPSMGGQFDNLIEGFERERGYEAVAHDPMGFSGSFRKPVKVDGDVKGYIEIEACTYESDPRTFHEDPDKELPYELCDRPGLTTVLKLDDRLDAYIPRKSLLFLYKLKALRDREHDLRTKGPILSPMRREWLQAKWVKDGSDLMALLDPEPGRCFVKQSFEVGVFREIVEEYGLQFCFESVRDLPNMRDSLYLYPDADASEVSDWVENLL